MEGRGRAIADEVATRRIDRKPGAFSSPARWAGLPSTRGRPPGSGIAPALPGTGGASCSGSQRARSRLTSASRGSLARLVHSFGSSSMVVELLRAIGVPDVPPSFRADGMVAPVVRGDGRPGARRGRVLELRDKAVTLQAAPGRQPAEVDEGGIDIKQLGGPGRGRAGGDARPREDQGDARRSLPERILAADSLLAQVPAVIGPEHDDRLIAAAGGLRARRARGQPGCP